MFRIFCIFTLCLSFSAYAQANKAFVQLSAGQSDIQFTEQVDNHQILNRESGQVKGVNLNFGYLQNPIGIEVELQHDTGQLAYSGLSQNAQAVKTVTTFNNQSVSALFVLPLFSTDYSIAAVNSGEIKLGLQYSESTRDIAAVPNIHGLDEQYQYIFLLSEASWTYLYTHNWSFSSELQLAWLADGNVKVDYDGLYDPTHLNLGQGYKHTISLAARYRIFDDFFVGLGWHYLIQNIGKSKPTKLTKNNKPMGQVYQPERALRQDGLQLRLEYLF